MRLQVGPWQRPVGRKHLACSQMCGGIGRDGASDGQPWWHRIPGFLPDWRDQTMVATRGAATVPVNWQPRCMFMWRFSFAYPCKCQAPDDVLGDLQDAQNRLSADAWVLRMYTPCAGMATPSMWTTCASSLGRRHRRAVPGTANRKAGVRWCPRQDPWRRCGVGE